MTGCCSMAFTLPPSKVRVRVTLLSLVGLMAGCSEIPGVLADIESLQDRTRALLEQRIEKTAAAAAAAESALEEAQTAYESAPGREWVFVGEPTPEDLQKQRLRDALQEARTARDDAVRLTGRVKYYLDDARIRHVFGMKLLWNAYEYDTWDMITPNVSPRSIVLGKRQEAERELRRLEAGCMSPVDLGSEPGCEDGGEQ